MGVLILNASSHYRLDTWFVLGAGIFWHGGSQINKKSASLELWPPPYFGNKFFDPPPITDTPYPLNRLKLYWNQVFLNKINTLSVVILWLPTFCHQKFYDSPIFLSKNLWPPSIFGTQPLPKKMPVPWNIVQIGIIYLNYKMKHLDNKFIHTVNLCNRNVFICGINIIKNIYTLYIIVVFWS